MMRFFRPNGSALLTLVAALLLATWPFFGTFTLLTLIAGIVTSRWMRSWHDEHPSTMVVPEGTPRSEINMSSIPVRGDGAGLLFSVGSVAILLALPQLRWFLIAAVGCAVLTAMVMIAWRSRATPGAYDSHPILRGIR